MKEGYLRCSKKFLHPPWPIFHPTSIFQWSFPYCAFHKHANSKVQKPPSQLRVSLPSIIIAITSNEPCKTETHKTDQNHKLRPLEPVKVKFCFLRGPLRWLTAAKNAIVSWLLNFKIRMSVKSAVRHGSFNPWLNLPEMGTAFSSLQIQ